MKATTKLAIGIFIMLSTLLVWVLPYQTFSVGVFFAITFLLPSIGTLTMMSSLRQMITEDKENGRLY